MCLLTGRHSVKYSLQIESLEKRSLMLEWYNVTKRISYLDTSLSLSIFLKLLALRGIALHAAQAQIGNNKSSNCAGPAATSSTRKYTEPYHITKIIHITCIPPSKQYYEAARSLYAHIATASIS